MPCSLGVCRHWGVTGPCASIPQSMQLLWGTVPKLGKSLCAQSTPHLLKYQRNKGTAQNRKEAFLVRAGVGFTSQLSSRAAACLRHVIAASVALSIPVCKAGVRQRPQPRTQRPAGRGCRGVPGMLRQCRLQAPSSPPAPEGQALVRPFCHPPAPHAAPAPPSPPRPAAAPRAPALTCRGGSGWRRGTASGCGRSPAACGELMINPQRRSRGGTAGVGRTGRPTARAGGTHAPAAAQLGPRHPARRGAW